MPSKRRTKSKVQPKPIPAKRTTRTKKTTASTRTNKTTASGKGGKRGQAGTTAAKKQQSRPLTTADISDIVTAVVEALPPRADNTTVRTQSSHGSNQRTTGKDTQPDQATDETTSSHGPVTRRETRSRRSQTSPIWEQQDATDEEDSEDEDFIFEDLPDSNQLSHTSGN